jgi:nucleotide-binding universal stress UspA family protein
VIRPPTGGGPFQGHVVVGVDGSPPGDAALDFAFSAAARQGLPLAAVHVRILSPIDSYVDDQTLELRLEEAVPGRDLLDQAVDPWAAKYPAVAVKRAVHHGSPVDGLRRAAAGSDLLVVGRRGHGGFARLMLGSASQALLLHAPCPVAVVGPG